MEMLKNQNVGHLVGIAENAVDKSRVGSGLSHWFAQMPSNREAENQQISP